MANTLAEYGLLSTSVMVKGIVKTIINESPLLRVMPFRAILGKDLVYNKESAEAGVSEYAVNEIWAESTTTWAQWTATLAIIGGDADVDKFVAQTYKNEQDLAAAIIALKSKAVADYFEKLAIRGYQGTTYSTKQFKGLMHLLAECESSTATDWDGALYSTGGGTNQQALSAGITSAALTLTMLDYLIDLVRPKPTHLMMSRRIRNRVNALAQAVGNNLQHDKDQLGYPVTRYGEQQILISDWVPDNIQDGAASVVTTRSWNPATTRASGYDNSVIFAMRFGEMDAVAGLTNGYIQTEDIGTLESKDANRTRIKFYVAMGNFGGRSLAGLINVLDVAL